MMEEVDILQGFKLAMTFGIEGVDIDLYIKAALQVAAGTPR